MTGLRWLAIAVVWLTASSAWAQPREVSAEDRATARSLMDEGDAKLAAGDAKGALEAYQGADTIMGVPTTAIEVAKAQAQLGLLVEAGDTLNRVMRFPQAADEPEPFAIARNDAHVLMKQVNARTPSIQVIVHGAPKGASIEVTIDSARLSAAAKALPRKVNPGKHQVRVVAGARNAQQEVDVGEGEKRTVTLELGVAPASHPRTEQGTRDKEQGTSGISPLVWVGFSIGAAGIIAGAITGGITLKRENDLEKHCPDQRCGPDEHDALDKSMTLAHVSTAMFALGGAGVALGIVGLAISDFGGGKESAIMFGPTFVGVRSRF